MPKIHIRHFVKQPTICTIKPWLFWEKCSFWSIVFPSSKLNSHVLMKTIFWICCLTSSHRRPYKHAIIFGTADRRASKRAFRFLCGPMFGLTCIHAIISLSPWGHGSEAPDKKHCKQWTSSLFCGFLPNPFIQDLFLWRTSQEFVKTDWYPLSLISLQYAVCLTGRWSIIERQP